MTAPAFLPILRKNGQRLALVVEPGTLRILGEIHEVPGQRGKCRVYFGDLTHDELMRSDFQTTDSYEAAQDMFRNSNL